MQDLIIRLKDIPASCMDKKLKLAGSYGIFKHAIDQKHGGLGSTFNDLVDTHKKLGRASLDPSLILSINAHLWGTVFPLYYFGTSEQREKYLNSLMEGKIIGGHAITEPQAGSNVLLMETYAHKLENSFIINGSKKYITNATILDVMLVYVKMEDSISALIVERDDEGVSFIKSAVSGFSDAPIGEILFQDCKIPKDRLVGQIGSGQMMIQKVLELERAFIFAGILGVMQWQLEEVIKYSRCRKITKGAAVYDLQAINHKIAEISLKLQVIDLLLHKCADLKDKNQRITLESAYTKLFSSEAFLHSSIHIAHIFGAFGLQVDQPFSQFVLDGLASTLFSGSSEIQKNIISSLL